MYLVKEDKPLQSELILHLNLMSGLILVGIKELHTHLCLQWNCFTVQPHQDANLLKTNSPRK